MDETRKITKNIRERGKRSKKGKEKVRIGKKGRERGQSGKMYQGKGIFPQKRVGKEYVDGKIGQGTGMVRQKGQVKRTAPEK